MTTDVSSALETLQLDPDNTQALSALASLHPGNGSGVDRVALAHALTDARRFHRERGDFELCVQLIDLELAWTIEAPKRADLLHEKGRILSDELLRDRDGQECVRLALEAVPDHAASLDSQSQMSLVQSNWEPISKRYLQQAEAATDPALASSLYLSLSEFQLKYGGAPGAAEGERFLRKSLELDPRNRRSSQHLERLLREAGKQDELLDLYGRRAEQAGSKEDRAVAELAAGELSDKLGRPDQALVHYKKALDSNPVEHRALRAVVGALSAQQSWTELSKILDTAARSKRGEQDVALLVEHGNLLWKQLGQVKEAEATFRRVRKLDPGNRGMVDFYREYFTGRNEIPQLVSLLAQAQKMEGDVARQVAMGIEMARAVEQREGRGEGKATEKNAEKAIDIWKGLLRLQPHLPEAVESLKRLYTRTEKWNALLELLKEDLETVPAEAVDEKVNRYLDIVAIYRDRLNLDVMVVNTYLSIVALKPDHPAALSALAARYEAQGRWTDLIQILTRQADAATETSQRLSLHRRVATLWAEKLGKHQNAVASLEKILETDPSDLETCERLKELYTRSRSWKALLEVFKKEFPHVPVEKRRDRLAEMARLASERLNETREAIHLWNQALQISERDPETLAGLASLYERERRWPALIEILDRQRQNAAGDPAVELPLLERQGTLLYEKLAAGRAAGEVFRRIQVLQPTHARAVRALREIYAQSGDFSALEALYVEQGAFGDLCDQLTALADRTADMTARTRMLERVATLSLEKLNQPERALKAYERILATDPQNRKAAMALIPLYRTAQKWPRLLATYEVLVGPAPAGQAADAGPTVPEQLQLLKEARRICEQRLASKSLAFQWCARAYALAPTDTEVTGDLERLAAEADEWGALAALFAGRLEAGQVSADERLWLLRRSLRVAMGRLYRPQEARKFAEQILAESAGRDDEAEAALEQILTQTKSWPDLAKLLHARADRTTDLAERAKMLFRIAQFEEEKVGDLAAAGRTLEAIIEIAPAIGDKATNERAVRGLTRVLEARQDWVGLVGALRREIDAGPRDAREELLLRIGQIQETRIKDASATFDTYRTVLEANPQSAAAVAGLERLLTAGLDKGIEIARLALPFYERTDNATRTAAAIETLLPETHDPVARRARLEKLRALYGGPLKNNAAAYATALKLFEDDPADRANRDQLIHFAAETQAMVDLTERMRAVANGGVEPSLRRDLLAQIAELHEQRLGRTGDAEKVYAEILSVEPLHQGAFRSLMRIYREGERWADLRSLIDARQDLVKEPSERLDLLAQMAEIDETLLDDPDHAISCYERMLGVNPADLRAYRALERHYAARERWRDLEELLGTRGSFAPAAEVPDITHRRAELRAARLDDIDGALNLVESIVRTVPGHEGARRLLEKLLSVPDQRLRVSRILEPLYESSGAWARLVAVLEVQREALQGSEAAAMLARIADLQENKLQARTAALATWRQVLTVADLGAGPDALAEVERLATLLERFSELVDVYQELAFSRDTADIAGRAELLSRAARLYGGRLGNRRAAIDAWKLVLNLDVDNLATAKPAAAALEGLYAETGDIAALVKILRQQARWAEAADERKALLFRIASLEEKSLGDTAAAVATLRSILEIDTENREAIGTLERIFEAGSNHRQRVEMLRRRIDLARDAGSRQELWRQVANLLERDVGDVDEAIAACVSILDESPEDTSALDTLARLYDQQGRHRDRLGILERRLALVRREAEPARYAAETEVLRQIARLYEGPLGDPANALAHWRQILGTAPGDADALAALERFMQPAVETGLRLAAAQALEPIYERAARWPELAEVIQVYVEAQGDPRARVVELSRLATLQETRLGAPEAAFVSYGLAIRDALGDAGLGGLLDAYERLAGSGPTSAARRDEVAALYRDITPDVLDEQLRLRLDRFVAETARTKGDHELAAEYFRRVLDRVPEDDTALAALDQIYSASGDAGALYEILIRRAELAKDPGGERRLRAQIGALAEKPLGRIDEAITAYERVLELAPHDRDAMQALDRLYTESERWSDLTRFLSEVVEHGLPEREVVAIRFRLAQIAHDRRHDKESALDHLRAVLRASPEHAGAVSMLEGMLDDIAVQGAAAELLEPVYAGRGDWPALIRAGEIRLMQVEDQAQRVAWTKRIARLYEEQLEDYDNALRWYGKVFQEAPTEHQSSEQLLRLAGKLDRWKDVGHLFADYLTGELGDSPEIVDITRRAAEIFDLRLGDRDEARKYYRRLHETRPDDREAALLFENALERWESWLELRELVDEQAGRAVDPAAKKAFLRRSAKLDEERLEDKTRAMRTLREVIDLDLDLELAADLLPGGIPSAASELERLLRDNSEWHDLSAHLAFMLERAPDARHRDEIALRLADVLEKRIDDLSGAIDRYAEILERTPGHREAIGALERLLENPDHRYRVAVILEPIYRKAGDWQKLVAVLDAELDTVEDRDDRVKILGEMAAIYQRLARIDLAFGCRSRAWLADVASTQALSEMETLAVSARLYGPLAETLQKGAVEATDPDLQARLWGMTARLIEEHLGDANQAIEAWRAALAARPDDLDSFLALERLLTAAARMDELVEVLEKHLEIATDPADRKLIAKRIAVLYELALKDAERAIRAWQDVLGIDDGDVEALDALAQLYLTSASWRELAEIFERKIQITQGIGDRRLLRLQAANLYDDKLGESNEAVSQLRAILDDSANDREALDALDRVFAREGRHADLLEVLDLRMTGEADAAAHDQLAFRAARLVEADLSDIEAAIARYQSILARTPRHAEAREALWAIARGSDYRLQAVAALDPILRAAREWEAVVELAGLRFEVEDTVAARLSVLAEIARIEEDERRDPAKAFAAWARALTEEATEAEPREALERLAATSGDYRGLASVYEERMEATFDAGLQRSLAVRLAELHEDQLGDLQRAADFLRKALSLPGDEEGVLASLDRVLRKLEAWEELAEILSREAEVTNDPTQQADFLAALGDTRLRSLDDAEGALVAYRGALERAAEHTRAHHALHELLERADTREGALEILEPLADARGDYRELVALYEHRLILHEDHAERAHWLRRIAEVYDGQLGDSARAIEALGRALAEEPAAGAALDEIERIAGAAKIPLEAARRIEAVLEGAEPDAARELALRAAHLYEQSAGEGAAAERLYVRVLETDPENIDALTALEGYYRAAADPARTAAILERRAAIEFDPQARKRLLMEASGLHERLGAIHEAITALRTLRAAEEGDPDVLGELARLYEATHQVAELTDVLGEKARFTETPTERAALYGRIGALKLGLLSDPSGAADAYREALESAPEDPAALAALETIAERLGDWSTLQDVLTRRLGAASGHDQVAVLLKLARNAEQKLKDLDQSIGFLHQILGIDGGNGQAFLELERLLGDGERWYDLVDVLTKHAEAEGAAGRHPVELALRVAIADVWEQKLDSVESAAEALEKVLEVAPNHVGALLSLARLHESAERWDEAGQALERAAAAVTSGHEAAEIQFRSAQILRAREAPAEEIEAALLKALESDQTHRPTLQALEAMARTAGDQDRLVQILELLLETTADETERKGRIAEIASLYRGPLDRAADAIPYLERLVELDPANITPREELSEALLGAGRIDEAAQLMLQIIEQLTRARRGKDVARYQQRLGIIAESRGDYAAAAESFNAAYKLDPSHAGTLAALGRIALRENDVERARKFYRSLLLQNFDEASAGVSKAEVYLALGQIHVMAREIPKARNMFERGLENDPKNEQLRQALASLPS